MFIDGTTSTQLKTTQSTTTVLTKLPTPTTTKTKASTKIKTTTIKTTTIPIEKVTTTTSKTTKTANTGKALAKTPLWYIKQNFLKLLIGTVVSWKWGPPKKDSRCGSIRYKADCHHTQCCSNSLWCGSTPAHCCSGCKIHDFRGIKIMKNTIGQSFSGNKVCFILKHILFEIILSIRFIIFTLIIFTLIITLFYQMQESVW